VATLEQNFPQGLVVETEPACCIILSGEIDLSNRDLVLAAIPAIGSVWLDMSGVTFIDSSGLNVLVGAYNRAKAAGHRVHVSGLNSGPLRVVEMSGLYDMLCRE
jgi:anti-sigma B factor antagonist